MAIPGVDTFISLIQVGIDLFFRFIQTIISGISGFGSSKTAAFVILVFLICGFLVYDDFTTTDNEVSIMESMFGYKTAVASDVLNIFDGADTLADDSQESFVRRVVLAQPYKHREFAIPGTVTYTKMQGLSAYYTRDINNNYNGLIWYPVSEENGTLRILPLNIYMDISLSGGEVESRPFIVDFAVMPSAVTSHWQENDTITSITNFRTGIQAANMCNDTESFVYLRGWDGRITYDVEDNTRADCLVMVDTYTNRRVMCAEASKAFGGDYPCDDTERDVLVTQPLEVVYYGGTLASFNNMDGLIVAGVGTVDGLLGFVGINWRLTEMYAGMRDTLIVILAFIIAMFALSVIWGAFNSK